VTPRTLQHPPTHPAQRKLTPEMPRIPGLAPTPPREPRQVKQLITVILAALLCVSGFALWLSHRRHSGLNASAASGTPIAQASTSDAPSVTKIDTEPNTIGTLYELAQPWSSKTFLFVDPKTQQGVPAMVIHLPGPPAEPSFWAFALTNPLSRCQLQFVTDLSALSLRFAYPAAHPMVVSDCDGVVYDPLKMATLPNGSWVRGYIVRGGGIRPPISIQVEVRGRDVIAKRME
jgi:hypothetical protein